MNGCMNERMNEDWINQEWLNELILGWWLIN